MTRSERVQTIHDISVDRVVMLAEVKRTTEHIRMADLAINYHYRELRFNDFIVFCQTGRYPSNESFSRD